MFNNPAKCFINGSDSVSFTYTPTGSTPWNWQPADCGLTPYRELNAMVFADTEEHALKVIEEMLMFMITKKTEYIKYRAAIPSDGNDLSAVVEERISTLRYYLDNKDKWVIAEMPTNQAYNIAWAGNDTF